MTSDVPLTARTPSPLGDYLRARRRSIAPEEVGIKRTKGRRTLGLRRAEVAELAGISLAYYSFIERGRDLRPSGSVLDGLARALQLDADQRGYLRRLAGAAPTPARRAHEELSEELEELLDSLDPIPAYVVGSRWDILGSTPMARRLFSDWDRKRRRRERNLLWFYCCDPAARTLFVDWEQEAADQLALFREAYARHPHDGGYQRVLDNVFAGNPDAQDWWERHDHDPARGRTKRIRLDDGRVVQLRQLVLSVVDDPDIRVIAYFSAADDDFELDS